MSYGGATLDILLRWTAKHEWVIGLALGSLAAVGVAFFLFLSSNIESSVDTATVPASSGCILQDMGEVTTTTSRSGSWASDCDSLSRSGIYARYYRFQLSSQSDVQIDLTSDTEDTYLYLHSPAGPAGAEVTAANIGDMVTYNDDLAYGVYDSRIRRNLAPGAYTIEATTYSTRWTASFNLTLSVTSTPTPTPTPAISASLTPDPSSVNLQPDGAWHRFTLSSSHNMNFVANPTGTSLRVEITNSASAGNLCPPEQNDYRNTVFRDGDYVYLAGCSIGMGTVQLLDASSNAVIRTYTFSAGVVPTPTPTPTPTPSPTDGIVAVPQPVPVCTEIDYGNLTAPELPRHPKQSRISNGRWFSSVTECDSPETELQAEFYTFTLVDNDGHVTIDLEAADEDTYLVLRSGGRDGDVLQENDDNPEQVRNNPTHSNARITHHLSPGTYTIEATIDRALSAASRPYRLTLKVDHYFPVIGHQADHTVVYYTSGLPPTRTPAQPVPTAYIFPTPVPTTPPVPTRPPSPPSPIGTVETDPTPVPTPVPSTTVVPTPVPSTTVVPTPVPPTTTVPTPVPPDPPDPPDPTDPPTPVPTAPPAETPCPDDGTNLDGFVRDHNPCYPHSDPRPLPTLPPIPTFVVPTVYPAPTPVPTPPCNHGGGGGDSDGYVRSHCGGGGGDSDAPILPAPPGRQIIVQIEDPGVLIPEAITHAVAQWNQATSSVFPWLRFCELGVCDERNTDNHLVWVTSEDDTHGGGCAGSVGCIRGGPRLFDPTSHIGSVTMVLEEPAFVGAVRYYWTDDLSLDEHEIYGPSHTPPVLLGRLKYAKSLVAHEFGHTAGLTDLYRYRLNNGDEKYEGYLMSEHASSTVPGTDLRYLQQAYRNQHGGAPHDN